MKILYLLPVIFVMSFFNASAFGVASDFLENDTLILLDGESKLYGIRIQNAAENEVQAKLSYDDSILKPLDDQETYAIAAKSSYEVIFNVTAPKNARPGKIYTVSYSAKEVSGGGTLPILLNVGKSFKLKIVEDPEKFYFTDLYEFYPQAIVISSIGLLIFFARTRTKKKKFKSRKIIKWKVK